jgi:hypothetical protein
VCQKGLEVCHQPGSKALDLFVTGHRAEHNLGKSTALEWTIANRSDHPVVTQQCEGLVSEIEHQTSNVFLRHTRELASKEIPRLREPSLQSRSTCQQDRRPREEGQLTRMFADG